MSPDFFGFRRALNLNSGIRFRDQDNPQDLRAKANSYFDIPVLFKSL